MQNLDFCVMLLQYIRSQLIGQMIKILHILKSLF